MAGNLTIESLDFEAIRSGDDQATGDALEFIWLALNNEASQRRRGQRQASERAEWQTDIISPTADVTDYDMGNVSVLRFDGAAAVNVTGLLAPSAGASRLLILQVLGAGTITLKHASLSSEEPNRILTYSAGDLAITTNKAVALLYQNSRWRELKWA